MKVEVLIIGAGPSGSACGIRLQQAGIECMLIDKQKFPRVKLCAGLFTHKSQDCLRSLVGDAMYDAAIKASLMSRDTQFSLYDGMKRMVTTTPSEPMTLLSRPRFDAWMVEHFVSLGGRFHDGAELVGIDTINNVATLRNQTVEYDYLIAADGANSTVERIIAKQFSTFKRKDKNPLCLEVNVKREDFDMPGVNIFFHIIPDSYAWSFAKGEEVCLGLVKLTHHEFDINAAMRKFMLDLGVKHLERYPLRGAMIPVGKYMEHPSFRNILFVGDAGGFVEPLTGEGIYHAMQSGVYAAESVIEGGTVGQAYERKAEYLKRLIDQGAYYQQLLEKPSTSRYFFRNVGKHPHFVNHFYETQIEHACLDPFWKIILKYKLSKLTRHRK